MTSDAIRQTSLLMGYRYCEEDFQPGHVEKATSDHLPDLSPDKQKAEIAIRQGDKRGSLRARAIFVFGEFISENITPLLNFAEYLSADDIATVENLKTGEGRIVRSGTNKIAACRDKEGELHLMSASCTHLGCVVHWNSLEQCWDCPCHGSQFAPDGSALNGPAVAPLAKVQDSKKLRAAE
jgi:nitrite reductase/ring-hydroxylating ferredoxin subunit